MRRKTYICDTIAIPRCDTKIQKLKNMNYPTTRFVFDRKKTATDKKAALVQVEIMHERKRKYVTTGVKIYKDQWNEKFGIVNRSDMKALNDRIDEIKRSIDLLITDMIKSEGVFSLDALGRRMNADKEKNMSFVEWVDDKICSRMDTTLSTKKTQRKLVTVLKDFGKIIEFSEITLPNIVRFDEYLRAKSLKQNTVWSYHKTLKTYIREAINLEIIKKDPYVNFKIKKGNSEWGRYVTPEEMEKIESAVMPTDSINKVRDLFVFQCYTGLAYSDLASFDRSRVRKKGNAYILSGERVKTGIPYIVVLLPKAMEILNKYDWQLPVITNQQYNMRLKIVADACGIEKPLASHYARRTCGMLLLNSGIPIEVVAKVLGHSNIKITQEVYARILDDSVVKAFEKLK